MFASDCVCMYVCILDPDVAHELCGPLLGCTDITLVNNLSNRILVRNLKKSVLGFLRALKVILSGYV